MLSQLHKICIRILLLRKKDIKKNKKYYSYLTNKNEIYRYKKVICISKNANNCRNYLNYSSENVNLPSQSQIVIAGAGTVANSVAYHLVLNGWNDVLVLEQSR